MPSIVIHIDCDDPSDFDWLKDRLKARVEDEVTQQQEEHRLDGDVQIWDEYED